MDDSKWERWGALGGILFVVMVVVAAFLPGSPPTTNDPTGDVKLDPTTVSIGVRIRL